MVAIVEAAGYQVAYKMTTMEADVFDAPAATAPSDVTIGTFSVTRDLDDGYRVIQETFPPDLGSWSLSRRDYEYVLRNDPTALPGLSVIARDAAGPVALALNYLDTMQPSSGFIGAMSVLPRRRREGIGRAVALETFERFRSRGWHHARLTSIFAMDAGSEAYQFYSGIGMRPIFDELVMRKA
jgi:GNAT superfamily N-acetyltransferase